MKRRILVVLTILLMSTIWFTMLNAKSLLISGEINKQSALQWINLILYYDTIPNESVITIYIDTNGGDVNAAYMVADIIKACKKPVETVVIGNSMSAGMIISIAGTKGLRFAYKHARFLIHEPYVILPKEYIIHDEDAKRYLENSRVCKEELIEWFLENTKIDQLSLEKYINDEYYFNAKEARKLGVIDQIVNYRNNPNRRYDRRNAGE